MEIISKSDNRTLENQDKGEPTIALENQEQEVHFNEYKNQRKNRKYLQQNLS